MPTAICKKGGECGGLAHWRNQRGSSIKALSCPNCGGRMTRAEWFNEGAGSKGWRIPNVKANQSRGQCHQCVLCERNFFAKMPRFCGRVVFFEFRSENWNRYLLPVDLGQAPVCWRHGDEVGPWNVTKEIKDAVWPEYFRF